MVRPNSSWTLGLQGPAAVFITSNETPLRVQLINELSSGAYPAWGKWQRGDGYDVTMTDGAAGETEGCKFLNRSSRKFVTIHRRDRQFDTLRVLRKRVARRPTMRALLQLGAAN